MTSPLFMRLFKNPITIAPHYIAVDTETERFKDPLMSDDGKTRLEPFEHPRLILSSMAGHIGTTVHSPESTLEYLLRYLHDGLHLVFHHAPFDVFVLVKTFPDLLPLFIRAVDQGRIHDTKILEVLIQIARGARTPDEVVLRVPKLKEIAFVRAGMALNKDPNVRLGFGDYATLNEIPHGHLEYAAQDAEATLRVFASQRLEAMRLESNYNGRYPRASGYAKWGLLSEAIQIKGALSLDWLERHPLCVDPIEITRRRTDFLFEKQNLQSFLLAHKYAILRKHRVGVPTFHLSLLRIRKDLRAFALANGLPIPMTESGKHVSTKADDWSSHLRGTGPGPIADWLRYSKINKYLTAYLTPLSHGTRHYPSYWNLGARTGRSSCSKPPAHQIPKHKDSLRSLFVPSSPELVLIEADFSAAELVSFAEILLHMFGPNQLAADLNDGRDPHIEVAARLARKDPKDVTDRERQAAKACNYGLPGGMGYKRLAASAKNSYKVALSLDDAKNLKASMLEASPALASYLSQGAPKDRLALAASNLLMTPEALLDYLELPDHIKGDVREKVALNRILRWRKGETAYAIPTPPGYRHDDLFLEPSTSLTGRIRGRCTFCSARNTPFQSLIGDALKLSLWNLFKTAHDAPGRVPAFSPVTQVHDSILVECSPQDAPAVAQALSDAMLAGIREVCPSIRAGVDLKGPMSNWAGAPI
jgi:hypothetical protein